jgi:RNA recognition motif-containing protein
VTARLLKAPLSSHATPPHLPPPPMEVADPKQGRLIVRNLSFKVNLQSLNEAFSKYGTIQEAKIPTKADGTKRGFAFVQFGDKKEAAKAIKALNMQDLLGRPIAVDFAVPQVNPFGLAATRALMELLIQCHTLA